jgi:hypothetical protein
MLLMPSTTSAPNAKANTALPTEPIDLDGVLMYLLPNLQRLVEEFVYPDYVEVIEPDKQVLLDTGSGKWGCYEFYGKGK